MSGQILKNVIGRREIIAYLLVGASVWGFLTGKISSSEFSPLVMAVVAFYFAQRQNSRDKK